ncbi:MAG: prolyl oligopeptidase family serine peptidase [Planctomycetaceae bacterium]
MTVTLLRITILLGTTPLLGADSPTPTAKGDRLTRQYIVEAAERIEADTAARLADPEKWTEQRAEYRRQLHDMLGLDPLPQKTPLEPVITGIVEHDEFTVEKLHFQSLPGLYVTGNLYVPKGLAAPAPAILYVCGHGRVVKDGVPLGNKTHYQHHGTWFARHGYVCLTIDTIQLGEIEGLHHGTYREGMWWWHSRGYTPAGVEAWNCIRSLDYLETRPEVDKDRLGVTGRSGGGAYSWWTAALDERIKVAVPVAGITSMRNHVIDDCIEGHCDCMFQVNTYRWDYPLLAALVAPRPLLISNTDKDGIFPLDGVYDVYAKVRPLWEYLKVPRQLGFHITEGPHSDTQELQVHAFVWFDRFLMKQERLIHKPAEKFFPPETLKVFDKLPADERVTTVHEWFVPVAENPVPDSADEWTLMKSRWSVGMRTHVFRNCRMYQDWRLGAFDHDAARREAANASLISSHNDTLTLNRYDRSGDPAAGYSVWIAAPHQPAAQAADVTTIPPRRIRIKVLSSAEFDEWSKLYRYAFPTAFSDLAPLESAEADQVTFGEAPSIPAGEVWIAIAPPGVGPSRWSDEPKSTIHNRRRLALMGQTVDGWRTEAVWEAIHLGCSRAGLHTEQEDGPPPTKPTEIIVDATGDAAVWALYASLHIDGIDRLELTALPASHNTGPALLNVLRYLDIPQALALTAEHSQLTISTDPSNASVAEYARATANKLGWPPDRVLVQHQENSSQEE